MDIKAQHFEEKINGINSSFLSALDDFKKYYVYYHKNPEVNEYSSNFVNSKNQLQQLSGEMFTVTNNIQKNIEVLDGGMTNVSHELTIEKNKNKELENLASGLKGTQDGSSMLINDTKREYQSIFFQNFELFIGILFILGLLVSPKAAIVLLVIAVIISYYLGILKILLPVFSYL
jgi:hypothetical protein